VALELNEFLYEFNAFIRNLKRTNVLKNWELPQITSKIFRTAVGWSAFTTAKWKNLK